MNYFGEGIGYTQGIGLTWEVDFDSFGEFTSRLFPKKRREEENINTPALFDLDSDFNNEYLEFIKRRGQQRNKNIKKEEEQEKTEQPPDPF